jgi:hypothetical protein
MSEPKVDYCAFELVCGRAEIFIISAFQSRTGEGNS